MFLFIIDGFAIILEPVIILELIFLTDFPHYNVIVMLMTRLLYFLWNYWFLTFFEFEAILLDFQVFSTFF
jgi:hypothetical protein